MNNRSGGVYWSGNLHVILVLAWLPYTSGISTKNKSGISTKKEVTEPHQQYTLGFVLSAFSDEIIL